MDIFQEYLRKKGIMGEPSFYAALAYGKLSVPVLMAHIIPDQKPKEAVEDGIIRKIFKKVSQKTRDLVLVNGLDEILVTFAKCCSPLQGDRIIGFITRGRGVTIHRVECPKVPDIDPERRVNADWNYQVELVRTAKIRIACESKTGMLAGIANTISDRKINITKAIVRTTKDEKAIIYLDVGVLSITELHSVMKAVERISGVISVEREI